MSGYSDKSPSRELGDAKARRKLLDQRRMAYRRAIESYAEQRQLQHELVDYPELIAANYLEMSRSLQPRLAQAVPNSA